jgi:hypothetical protein
MTALLLWAFVSNVVNILRGVDAPVALFSSFIDALGCFTLMLFVFVFHRAQRSSGFWRRGLWGETAPGNRLCGHLAA